MSAFDNLLGRGFGLLLDKTAAPTLSKGRITVKCICTPIGESKELRDAGYWPKFHGVAELKRADFDALDLVLRDGKDRPVVTYRDARGKKTLKLKVIAIEDDGADPCVKITLQEEPKTRRAS